MPTSILHTTAQWTARLSLPAALLGLCACQAPQLASAPQNDPDCQHCVLLRGETPTPPVTRDVDPAEPRPVQRP